MADVGHDDTRDDPFESKLEELIPPRGERNAEFKRLLSEESDCLIGRDARCGVFDGDFASHLFLRVGGGMHSFIVIMYS